MANQREARQRMRAIKQTLQVTQAMSLISTAKLRKARTILAAAEPYFHRIQQTMREIMVGQTDVRSAFFPKDEPKGRSVVIVITSEKGLAGGYNAAVYRYVMEMCKKLSNPVLITIGNVGQRFFERAPYVTLESFSFGSGVPDIDDAREVAEYVISQFEWGVFHDVHIVYTHMFSVIKTQPMEKSILPLNSDTLQQDYITEAMAAVKAGVIKKDEIKELENLRFDYIPSRHVVFDLLAPHFITGVIFGSLIESYAAEQSARMNAMDEASRNGDEMYQEQLRAYNRVRQQMITQEMTEIVSGSAAISD
ncbi:MAG: ATP synthase F1 subunit gamma [Spirochaetaceae bacterium]|jgi:F-type H+-transporting ATPase subunit gamma|nr:ATP synthase F1 subunit gamma [Spirochaetaceae bacterium]